MARSGSTVIVSAIVMIAIVAIIAFIFILFVFFMTQVRRVSLKNAVKRLLENEKNDGLQINKKLLGKMYPKIEEMWNKRADITPIPAKDRIQKGWLKIDNIGKDGEDAVVNIREEIAESPRFIEEAAIQVNPKFAREKSMTIHQYLQFLVKHKVGKLTVHKCQKYLSLYSQARFGPDNITYEEEDYFLFLDEQKKIIKAIVSDD